MSIASINNILLFFSSFFLSIVFTFIIAKIAVKLNILDIPRFARKIHKQSTPLMGGIAIFLAFFCILYLAGDRLIMGNLEPRHWIGFFIGACWLIIGGALDDKYDLKPGQQLIFPVLAAISVIAGGIGIEKITNPFGGYLLFDQLKIPILAYGGSMHYFWVVSDTFVLVWLLGMSYTTKLLDGLDGLVSGITSIGCLIIFLFTTTTKYYQPDIATAAIILAGACLGFLIFNWHPAKIFLGEGGSLFLGFSLGVLSIISGGKIAVALLIMGIPILDVIWTIVRRLASGQNPFRAHDRKHLHHRIHDLGFGTRKTVLIFYLFAAAFGLSALFLQSKGKLLALTILIAIMIGIIAVFNNWDRKSSKE